MSRIAKALKALFGEDTPERKYIGHIGVRLEVENRFSIEKRGMFCSICFYMNDEDDRSVEIVSPDRDAIDYIRRHSREYAEALLWKRGGKFPKSFIPLEDPLVEMLVRMTANALTGDK